jgi:hypothetical protein
MVGARLPWRSGGAGRFVLLATRAKFPRLLVLALFTCCLPCVWGWFTYAYNTLDYRFSCWERE